MKIYNTLTGQKEDFKPIEEGKAGIYVCGPTVYNFIHIGNARPICVFDVFRRYLEFKGYDVTFIQNYTDVNDKIIKQAKLENSTPEETALKYIHEYETDAKGLNVRPADVHPKVSLYMDKIIDMIQTLVDNGYAYESTLENSIAGIRISKAFVAEEYENEKFNKGNNKFKEVRRQSYKVMAEYFAGVNFGVDVLDYVVLIAGGIFTYYNAINLGDFLAYMLYVKLFTDPIKKLINFVEQYQNGMTGFKRFIDIMNVEEEIEKDNAVELEKVEGNISFENVCFSYENEKVLDKITLSIEKGKMLALVGPSGGGKTTFCNLIPRFYDVDNGDIKIDGKSIYDIKLDSLRKNIGIVQQEVFLYTGTIKENIKYGKQDASDDEVIEAAKKANIHEFIMGLKDGYDTYIGERGIKLSGGQKQRISIARVFLKNPPILILDEATSALDNVTEYLIQKSLEDLCG